MGGGRNGHGRSYSTNSSDYQLLEEVGHGATATVFRAIYLPFNEIVAVKCLDLDRCNSNLDDIRREAQTMSLIDHPNVIRAYCSFVVDQSLWVVMPFMDQGSCLHLMKIAYPDGFEEDAIGSILKETLKALTYLHAQGQIHRDVKAGNVLLDGDGAVKLADFGVSACMFDSVERQRARSTFVGTPCWMAPEVLQPESGYNSKADIWSFGITALELAHGHAPFSKYPPIKVLLMTIQNAPPGLNYSRDKKFSKSFKEMVAMCLAKDQSKRPTAEKLLKHAFFKNVRSTEHLVKKLFADLPPLWNRVKALQLKDAANVALKKMRYAEEEALSQNEYKRGVSAWNFDVGDLRFQASAVSDISPDGTEVTRSGKSTPADEVQTRPFDSPPKVNEGNAVDDVEENMPRLKNNGSCSEALEKDATEAKSKIPKASQSLSGPLLPESDKGRNFNRQEVEIQPAVEKVRGEVRKVSSFNGPLVLHNRASANSLSAPNKSSGGFRDSLDEKTKSNLVQIKGRFSVTSENLDLVKDVPIGTVQRRTTQTSPMKKSASVGEWKIDSKQMPAIQTGKDASNNVSSSANGNLPSSVIVSHLQNLFQQISLQQDTILNLMSSLQLQEAADVQNGKLPNNPHYNGPVEAAERERLLVNKVDELQTKMSQLTDELNAERLKYSQLHQLLNSATELDTDS